MVERRVAPWFRSYGVSAAAALLLFVAAAKSGGLRLVMQAGLRLALPFGIFFGAVYLIKRFVQQQVKRLGLDGGGPRFGNGGASAGDRLTLEACRKCGVYAAPGHRCA